MELAFCIACHQDALNIIGKPEIFNREIGSHETFIGALVREISSRARQLPFSAYPQ
jgi:hypothetical protein